MSGVLTSVRAVTWALLLVGIVLPTPLLAQTQLKGGVSTDAPGNGQSQAAPSGDVFSANSPCAGRDPLKGKCQQAPKVLQGGQTRCVPPNPQWQLVAQDGNTCWYYAPYQAGPIQGGEVVDIRACPELERRGGRCAANPNDRSNRTAIYTPPPGPLPGRATPNNCPSYYPEKWAGVPGMCGNPPAAPPSPGPGPQAGGTGQPRRPGQPSSAPPANPSSVPPTLDPVGYARGLVRGLEDCAGTFRDMAAAAGMMVRGDFVSAAQTLGLEPGTSVLLRTIYREAQTQNLGITPEEAGRIAGRRLCAYAIVPSAAKGALKLPKAIKGLAPSGSRLNPLEGSVVTDNAANLEGKWIRTQRGPVQLGDKLGSGKFGSVYKLPRGRAIKVSTNQPGSPQAFKGQVKGQELLKNAGIPTPTIYDAQIAIQAGDPSFLVMDDVTGSNLWPKGEILGQKPLTLPKLQGIDGLYRQIRDAGLTWADGTESNAFWFGDGAAGVLDADMVFDSRLLAEQPYFTQSQIVNVLGNIGLLQDVTEWPALLQKLTANPKLQMDYLFNARYESRFPGALTRKP